MLLCDLVFFDKSGGQCIEAPDLGRVIRVRQHKHAAVIPLNKSRILVGKESLNPPASSTHEIVSWPAPGSTDTELGVLMETGGVSWRGGSLHASSSLRLCG